MDAERPNASLLRWNYSAQNWSNVTNTTTEPQFGNAVSGSTVDWTSASNYTAIPFFLFARGDKTITTTTGFNAGRLRAVGRLLTGPQVFNYPGVSDNATKYVASANPYASPVNFETLRNGFSANLNSNKFYLWDPSLNNFGTFGGWVEVTRNGVNDYTAVPAYTGVSNANIQFIPSGVAFLVDPITDNNASSITYAEADKATTVSANTNGAGNGNMDKLVVTLNNTTNNWVLDGAYARFSSNFSNNFVDIEDGVKL
ncbi:MAG: hypothetical protein ACOVOV_07800, partial [Dolichospermum sp.]